MVIRGIKELSMMQLSFVIASSPFSYRWGAKYIINLHGDLIIDIQLIIYSIGDF